MWKMTNLHGITLFVFRLLCDVAIITTAIYGVVCIAAMENLDSALGGRIELVRRAGTKWRTAASSVAERQGQDMQKHRQHQALKTVSTRVMFFPFVSIPILAVTGTLYLSHQPERAMRAVLFVSLLAIVMVNVWSIYRVGFLFLR